MYINTLPPETAKLFTTFSHQDFLRPFYLTGGTALSLLLGHRESEDLDFFSKDIFNPMALQQKIAVFGKLDNVEVADGTLNLFLRGVKLQFLHYPYQLLEPTTSWEGVSISSDLDIACTKLITISMRGSKKDFIDLFFLTKKYSLQKLFEKLPLKYSGTEYNQLHVLKSLVYFTDAEEQPMPRMHADVSWSEVKSGIIAQVKKLRL